MESRKISISLGLLAIVAMHALLLRAPMPKFQYDHESLPRSFSFDSIERNISNPEASRVNIKARDEIKNAECMPSANKPASQDVATEAKGQAQAQRPAKRYNLDLFIANDAQSQNLLRQFNTDPTLRGIAARCNYQVYAPGDELYRLRYQAFIPVSQFPAIVLTHPDGGHVYIASQTSIPSDPSAIKSAIREATEMATRAAQLANRPESAESNCPDGKCPPQPTTQPHRPFFPPKIDPGEGLFPIRQPNPEELITSFFHSSGIGLESVALLLVAVVVIVVLIRQR